MRRYYGLRNSLFVGILTIEPVAAAQTTEAPSAPPIRFEAHGYAEIYTQVNFNLPSNSITNYRGFDNRHATFMISNVAVDLAARTQDNVFGGRLILQVGSTPDSYYMSEPLGLGAGGASSLNAHVWKYVQQAFLTFRPRINQAQPLSIEAGLFMSPFGPEAMSIKDNWNWSYSNLFVGLPFYHFGGRVNYAPHPRWTLTFGLWNGWNNILDNNVGKSFHIQAMYTVENRITWSLSYFTGIERSNGAAEGQPWRHAFDSYLTLHPSNWLSLQVHTNGGFEPHIFGISAWIAGALYLRIRPVSWLYLAARGDFFYEHVPSGASSIYWPVAWLSSGTFTIDARPVSFASLRLEYRYDAASGPLFFRGMVMGDGSPARPFIPNATDQQTLTLGLTGWF